MSTKETHNDVDNMVPERDIALVVTRDNRPILFYYSPLQSDVDTWDSVCSRLGEDFEETQNASPIDQVVYKVPVNILLTFVGAFSFATHGELGKLSTLPEGSQAYVILLR